MYISVFVYVNMLLVQQKHWKARELGTALQRFAAHAAAHVSPTQHDDFEPSHGPNSRKPMKKPWEIPWENVDWMGFIADLC